MNRFLLKMTVGTNWVMTALTMTAVILGVAPPYSAWFWIVATGVSTGLLVYTGPKSTPRQAKLDSRRRKVAEVLTNDTKRLDDLKNDLAELKAEKEIMYGEHSLWGRTQAGIDHLQVELDAEAERQGVAVLKATGVDVRSWSDVKPIPLAEALEIHGVIRSLEDDEPLGYRTKFIANSIAPDEIHSDFCPGGATYSDEQVTYGRRDDDIRRSFIDCPGGQPHWHPRVRVV